MSLRGDAAEVRASAAAQRGDDHDFVVCTQDMVDTSSHVAVDEKADVRANAILFIDDAVAHAWVAPIENIELCAGGSVRCMLAELHLPRVR